MYLHGVADEGVVDAVPVPGPGETDVVVGVEPHLQLSPAQVLQLTGAAATMIISISVSFSSFYL